MSPTPKKIALIVKGATKGVPEGPENGLMAKGYEITYFDVDTIDEKDGSFVDKLTGTPINFEGYEGVVRFIQGGKDGDTKTSWKLQQRLEEKGAKPYITIADSERVTDKAQCRSTLNESKIPMIQSVTVNANDAVINDEAAFEKLLVETLGAGGKKAVKKILGSGQDSLVMVDSAKDALAAVKNYRDTVQKGSIIHKLPQFMDAQTAETYGLKAIEEPEKRPYHFRVFVLDNAACSAAICYSEPNKFGLNEVQGATFEDVAQARMPAPVLQLAENATAAHHLKFAAVDIALDEHSKPYVMDMNVSPRLTLGSRDKTTRRPFKTFGGKDLNEALADSIDQALSREQTKPLVRFTDLLGGGHHHTTLYR